MTQRLSAAICTRNRPAQLVRAIRSLMAQRVPLLEVLVVDNASDDGTIRRLIAAECPTARYVAEPVEGLNMARNRALQEARGELLAFLDDDAVAERDWAASFLAAFHGHPRVAVCLGRVEALALETEAQRLFEANGGFSRGMTRICLPEDASGLLHGWRAPRIAWAVSVGNGASFAVRREAVLALGGFDEALDLGEALPGGGDLDLFWRALCAGDEVLYEPAALARHEHRRQLEVMAEQVAGHQRALVAFLCKSAASSAGWTRVSILAFLGWRLLKPGARLLRRVVGREPLPARVLLQMWGSAMQGLWAYPVARQMIHKRRAAVTGEPAVSIQ